MHCLDCTTIGSPTTAVGVCHCCGAGVCVDHAKIHDHYLTRSEPIDQVIRIEPPARSLWCGACAAANEAAVHHDRRHGRPGHSRS